MRKGIILFEAIGPFHVNGSVSFFFVKSKGWLKNLPGGPSSECFKMASGEKS